MLLRLNKNGQEMSEESILTVINFIKGSSIAQRFPLELFDDTGLINSKTMKFALQKIKEINYDGFMYVYLNHNCKITCDPSWAKYIGELTRDTRGLFIPIEINIDDDMENIRALFEEPSLEGNIHLNIIIDKENFDINRWLNIMPKYNIHNYITLSIDHTKKLDYKSIAKTIVDLTAIRKKKMIAIEFGCGFPSCMFNDSDLGILFKSPMMDMRFYCRPRLAINADLSVNYCADDRSYKLQLSNMKNVKDMYEQFELIYDNSKGIYADCDNCWSKDKLCNGGCPL